MSVRVIYEDVAVGAAEAASVASTAAKPFSDLPELPYGTEPVIVATNELNQWVLDGSRPILTTERAAFWSSAPSKADCTFDANPTLTITLDGTFASSGIYLYFDGGTGDYCSALTMTWYNGETAVASQDFTPDGQKYFCAKPVTGYNKLVIELKKTSLPYRYAKLRQIFFGIVREFEREDLRSVSVTEGVSVISDDVEINTLDFTLDNSDDIDFIFQEKQPVSAYDGAKLIGVFYIKSSSRSSERLYDVSCQDALGILDDEPFAAAVYSSKNAKELITSILGTHFSLDFDPALEDETVTGHIPDCTKREALQQIVFALRATIDTSASRGVRVRRLTAAAPAMIPLDRTYTGGSVETAAVVTEIRVTAHSYSTSGSGESVEVGGTTYYHTTSVTSKANPNATTQTKPNVIEVRDATLVNSDNVAAVAQHVFDYYMRRQTHSVKIVMDKEAPGDYVQTTTPWGTKITGTITSMDIRLSGIAAAECKIIGT
jgi:hypothetical protein